MNDMAAVLGRLIFTVGALENARPFLALLCASSSAAGDAGERTVPWSSVFLSKFIKAEVEGATRMGEVHVAGKGLGVAFLADAKVEGVAVRIGVLASLPP